MNVRLRLAMVVGCGLGTVAIAGCPPAASSRPAQPEGFATPIWVGCDTMPRTSASGTTPVEICAAADARLYGPGNASPRGQPVARMRNLGTEPDTRWGLRPRRVYVIAIHSDAAGTGYKIWPERGGGPIRTGTYYPCGHGGESPPTSSATFGACTDSFVKHAVPQPGALASAEALRGPMAGEAPAVPGHALYDRLNGPAWVSCTDGCCTTDAQ